jgi:hypothetical protein
VHCWSCRASRATDGGGAAHGFTLVPELRFRNVVRETPGSRRASRSHPAAAKQSFVEGIPELPFGNEEPERRPALVDGQPCNRRHCPPSACTLADCLSTPRGSLSMPGAVHFRSPANPPNPWAPVIAGGRASDPPAARGTLAPRPPVRFQSGPIRAPCGGAVSPQEGRRTPQRRGVVPRSRRRGAASRASSGPIFRCAAASRHSRPPAVAPRQAMAARRPTGPPGVIIRRGRCANPPLWGATPLRHEAACGVSITAAWAGPSCGSTGSATGRGLSWGIVYQRLAQKRSVK